MGYIVGREVQIRVKRDGEEEPLDFTAATESDMLSTRVDREAA